MIQQKKIYDSIFIEGSKQILESNVLTDPHLSQLDQDKRRSLAVIIPMPEDVKKAYRDIRLEFMNIAPGQYYYPEDDLHITAFEFLPGRENLSVSPDETALFREIFQSVVKKIKPFEIVFKGVTASSSAVLIQGYDNFELERIRKIFRDELCLKNIEINERYQSRSAHLTFLRFKNKIGHPLNFMNYIYNMRNIYIGRMTSDKMELVVHDWYNLSSKKSIIDEMTIK